MKYSFHKLIWPLLLVAILGGACKKKLKEYNPSGVTGENLYATPAGFESLVNAVYSYQRFWYGKEAGYAMTEAGTDLWAPGRSYTDRPTYLSLLDYKNLNGVNAVVQAEWAKFYAALNLCNVGLSRISQSGLPANIQRIRTAELRFLRAFYNWHIVETWGDAPFTTTEIQGAVTVSHRISAKTIYDQIIADLEHACGNLPKTTPDYGRATKAAAQAFLSRVYLTRGYGSTVVADLAPDPSYFQKAIDTAKAVILNGGYSLVPSYADLWPMNKVRNPEVIYAVNYTVSDAYWDITGPGFPDADGSTANINQYGDNNGHMMFLTRYEDFTGGATVRDLINGRAFQRYAPTLHLLNLFDVSKDSRYEGSFQTVWFATKATPAKAPIAAMAVGDTSLAVYKDEIPAKNNKYYQFDQSDIYDIAGNKAYLGKMTPNLKKFMDPTRKDFSIAQSARDAFVIRYAEIYLIIAEAYTKLGNTADAATYVNVIRDRAAKPGKKADMIVSAGDITLDFILDERAREFAGEQLRWFDLKRTGKLEERVKAHNPNIGGNFVSPTHWLRPIPQNQMDAVSNSDFKQNPGY